MKKIEGYLINETARVYLLLASVLLIPLFFSLIPLIIKTEVNAVFILALVYFVIFSPILLFWLSKYFLKVKLTFEYKNGKPIIESTGLMSKSIIEYPFKYDATLTPMPTGLGKVNVFFKLTIYREHQSSLRFFEKLIDEEKIPGIIVEPRNKTSIPFMAKNTEAFPDVVWKIFRALEKLHNPTNEYKLESESPFLIK